MTSRITRRFAALREEGRAGLITFLTAGDPDMETFERLLHRLPEAGADLIEIGMPFSDPMADGPAIQAASLRALAKGFKLKDLFPIIARFRASYQDVPVILMGYYNPIYRFGPAKPAGKSFAMHAGASGADGVIVVDLPPEESEEFLPHLRDVDLDLIRLTAPTSDDARLPKVLGDAGGFVYHVAIAGITGTRSADAADVEAAVTRIRRHTRLPVAVGFGIRTPEQAAAVARVADAAVVGTALVETVARFGGGPALADHLHRQVAALAHGVRNARASGGSRL